MPYRVIVRGAEVVADSLDELDALLDRYAGEVSAADGAGSGRAGAGAGSRPEPNGGKDGRLLKAFVEAGSGGVTSGVISQMLGGARGKALPPGMRRWAERVGLSGDSFQKAYPNGQRGWRLTDSALGAARLLGTGRQ